MRDASTSTACSSSARGSKCRVRAPRPGPISITRRHEVLQTASAMRRRTPALVRKCWPSLRGTCPLLAQSEGHELNLNITRNGPGHREYGRKLRNRDGCQMRLHRGVVTSAVVRNVVDAAAAA